MKKSIILAAFIAMVGFSGMASAHDYLGTLLSSPSLRTDKWYFRCSSSTNAKITYRIKKTAGPAGCVNAKSTNPVGATVQSCTTGAWSSTVTVQPTGAGFKFFDVWKTVAGSFGYDVEAHCTNSNGTHGAQTEPQTYTQNQ